MTAKISSRTETSFKVEVEIPYRKSMLDFEEVIQSAVNSVGQTATEEALTTFDSDGSPILIGENKLTSKGQEPKTYQTPFGTVSVQRHVYQGTKGGKTHVPLELNARIILTSTPKFAKMVSSKYADLGSSRVQADLKENHGRSLARRAIQDISEAVSSVIEAKETAWDYAPPELNKSVSSIAIGMDGTCMLMCEDGYREAMVGTIALYDKDGERLHTSYMAASPEYGKEYFLSKLAHEITQTKARYPEATYIGLADGAKCNWTFLEGHTNRQTIDFWHATEYLGKAASAMFKKKSQRHEKEEWMEASCHKLKHTIGGASRLLREMENVLSDNRLSSVLKQGLESAITYFSNNKSKMKYAQNLRDNLPIGSGVTEAACKVIVKQRLCGSAMKWKETGASVVLRLRCMNYTAGKWAQFWNKVGQYGLPLAA